MKTTNLSKNETVKKLPAVLCLLGLTHQAGQICKIC